MDYSGVIIEESLADPGVLKRVRIVSTHVDPVIERHRTPWLSRWTLHTVSVPEAQADSIAEEISRSFDCEHEGSWYADFKNDRWHIVVFPGRVFRVGADEPEGYAAVKAYGISVGIPDYQLDFEVLPR
jgi:hypothetical protein